MGTAADAHIFELIAAVPGALEFDPALAPPVARTKPALIGAESTGLILERSQGRELHAACLGVTVEPERLTNPHEIHSSGTTYFCLALF